MDSTHSSSPAMLANKLTSSNWYLFKDELFDILNLFGKAGEEIRTSTATTLPADEPTISATVRDKGRNEEGAIILLAERPWNDHDLAQFQKEKERWLSAVSSYQHNKSKLWYFLIRNITPEILQKLKVLPNYEAMQQTSDCLQLWTMLKSLVLSDSTNTAAKLRVLWGSLQQYDAPTKNLKPIREFFRMFDGYLCLLNQTQSKPTDSDIVEQLIESIHFERYMHLLIPITTDATKRTELTYATLKTSILKYEEQVYEKATYLATQVSEAASFNTNGETNQALFTKNTNKFNAKNKKKHNKAYKATQNTARTSSDAIICHNCGVSGHKSPQCTSPPITCNICQKQYHMAKFCRSKSTKPGILKDKAGTTNAPKKQVKFEKASTATAMSDTGVDFEEWSMDEESIQERAFMLKVNKAFAHKEPSISSTESSITVDSGATIHVFVELDIPAKFAELTMLTLDDNVFLQGIDGVNMQAIAKGTIPNIGRFYVVPSATQNLLSVPELVRNGHYKVTFDSRGCIISSVQFESIQPLIVPGKSNAYSFSIARFNQLVRLIPLAAQVKHEELTMIDEFSHLCTVDSAKSSTTTANCTEEEISVANLTISSSLPIKPTFSKEQLLRARKVLSLHSYLGHCSNAKLISALNHGVILGSELTAQDVHNATAIFGKCIHCIAGKSTRPSYNHISIATPPAHTVGSKVHCDLYIFSQPTLGGNNFALLCVDEYSGHLTMLPLKHKSTPALQEAFSILISIYKAHSHVIEVIQTDAETSLIACKSHLGMHHIHMLQVPPYQHAQRIERYVRIVKDHMRSILDSLPYDLPPFLYGELLSHVTTLLNDLPNSLHPTMSPRILFNGNKLDLNIRPNVAFGTLAMFHTTDKPQPALAPRAQLGIILGPAISTYNAMRCYVFTGQSVVTRHSFTIVEKIPLSFAWKLKSYLDPSSSKCNNILDSLLTKVSSTKQDKNSAPNNLNTSTASADYNDDMESDTSFQYIPRPKRIRIDNNNLHTDVIVAENGELIPHIIQNNPSSTSNGQGNSTQISFNNPEFLADEGDIEDIEPPEAHSEDTGNTAGTPIINDNSIIIEEPTQEENVSVESQIAAILPPTMTEYDPSSLVVQGNNQTRRSGRKTSSWQDGPVRLRDSIEHAFQLSVKDALDGPFKEQTIQAVIDEVRNMLDYQVGKYVKYNEIPKKYRNNLVRSFMFIKHKHKPDGQYDKTKARLVADGKREPVHLYDVISSSTVTLSSIFMILNMASYYKAHIVTYDIKGAFLHALTNEDEDEPIYITIGKETAEIWIRLDPAAKDFLNEKGELVLRLDRFIYGLKQSPYKFQQLLCSVLKQIGYHQCVQDDCVFIKFDPTNPKRFSILSLHVDDILQIATDNEYIKELREHLVKRFKDVTFHETIDSYVGMTVQQSLDNHTILLSQRGLIDSLLEKFLTGDDVTSYVTPAATDLFCNDDTHSSTSDTYAKNLSESQFQSLVMSLMYLARLTRPDILLAVTFLASKAHAATLSDKVKLLRILRYLRGTKEKNMTIQCTSLDMKCYCDASYSVHADGKSHSGYVISFGNNAYIHARSFKQRLTALSSTDAEIIAYASAVQTCSWLRALFIEMRPSTNTLIPIEFYQDNKSCIWLTTEQSKFKRSKHLLTRISYIRDYIQSKAIASTFSPSEKMTADTLTKPLQGSLFHTHSCSILGSLLSS